MARTLGVALTCIVLLALLTGGHGTTLRQEARRRAKKFETWAECTYRDTHHHRQKLNYTRADVWTCLTTLADTNHDNVMTEQELKKGIDAHLTTGESWAIWNAQSVIDRCFENEGHSSLSKAQFFGTDRRTCIGCESDICHVFSVCRRELGTENGRPAAH